jgi:peptide-methionine (S)-S-oxide reductase
VRRRILLAAVLLAAGGFALWGFMSMRPAAAQSTLAPPPPPDLKTAAFAGGCFWCMVHPFDHLDGVSEVISGYTGGTVANPEYHQVVAGVTGHREAVRIVYDPAKISYEKLLEVFWRNVDPLDSSGQFCDHGEQYTTAIFVADAGQRQLAEESKAAMDKRFGRPVATVIVDAGPFYKAEDYHQNYYKNNPMHYKFYRYSCGRDAHLEKVWGAEARDGEPRPVP